MLEPRPGRLPPRSSEVAPLREEINILESMLRRGVMRPAELAGQTAPVRAVATGRETCPGVRGSWRVTRCASCAADPRHPGPRQVGGGGRPRAYPLAQQEGQRDWCVAMLAVVQGWQVSRRPA